MRVRGSLSPCSFLVRAFSLPTLAALFILSGAAAAQQTVNAANSPSPQPLITQSIDEAQLTTLQGNTHPLARPQYDLGTASATLPMERMLLVLKRSPQQEAALRQFLDAQQDKNSPEYHHWLTPEEFGRQFGLTDADIQTITNWLQSHGFQVGTTKGHTVLEFSGSASQVQEAFHTTIHKYLVRDEQHWANASDPQIPTALAPAVAGIASLNNFPRKAMNVRLGTVKRDKATGKFYSDKPQVTEPGGCTPANECYGVGPYDFAAIYNLTPLWNSGIDGTGVTIAISGETDIQMSDVQTFRSTFGLPANNPVFVYNGPDPGTQPDESEADIDVQWSGAVAKGATIDFVISQSTETTSGVDLSAVYIVDQNLAPIMSESYGECELGLGTAGNQFYNALWQQAAAEGITVFISAGDAGSAGCDNFAAQSPAPARYGLQVSGYASTPYNVAVGGTDFNDFANSTTYWSSSNGPNTLQSVLSYIPETTWNDSCTNALFATLGFSSNAETNCNNAQLEQYFVVPGGGSGGVSACTTPSGQTPASCAGGYSRPSWQNGSGSFSSDGKRDIPDVSLFASNGFVGEAYLICQSDQGWTCQDGSFGGSGGFGAFGGTSVSSPAFAGIMALVNQKYGRQGNANYVFYKLAAKTGASCNSSVSNGTSSSCIFNDVTNGTNAMPCATGSANCQTTVTGDLYGVLTGYNAGAGYDMATGLGSVNANNLVTKWNSISLLPSSTSLSSLTPTTIMHGQSVTFSGTVQPQSGTGAAPTGQISLTCGSSTNPQSAGAFNLGNTGTFSGTTEMLPGGTYSVNAHYPGDANYSSSNSTPGISVTVKKENSEPQVFLVTFNSNGSVATGDTTVATYGSPYILRVNVGNSAGQMCNPIAASGATACPTGTVAMTDNNSALDAGTYTLNSAGYFEDWTVQLPGGTNSIKAAYAGDSSFNAASATASVSITPATTNMAPPTGPGGTVGSVFSATVTVNSSSSGLAPTGTVTFSSNGTAIPGSVAYVGTNGSLSYPASLIASFVSNNPPFTSPGTYSITAAYSGDANYATATSGATILTVKYQTPQISFSPLTQTVNPGATATVTALVDSSDKTVYPTGTVTFVNTYTSQTIGSPVPCANAKDSNGYYACQGSVSFTPSGGNTSIVAEYSGDANYPATSSAEIATVSVPDFSLTAYPVTVSQGQSQTVSLSVNALGGFSGTVTNFSCSGLPAEATCSFNPTSISGQGSTTLTISTAAVGQLRHRASNTRPRISWMAAGILPLLSICFIGISMRERKKAVLASLLVLAIIATFPSCGGSGGGGGGGQNNPMPSITSLSPTQQAAGSTSQVLVINGTGFVSSSTVTYNGTSHISTYLSASQLNVTLSASDLATSGTFPVVVTNPTPGGGASGPVNFSVVSGTPTGNFTVTVTATSGSLTHGTTFALTVQ